MSTAAPDSVATTYRALTEAQKKAVRKTLSLGTSGSKALPMAAFCLLGAIAIGLIGLIIWSYSVASQPDVTAAWATLTAIVGGVIGLFVPTPQRQQK
jgi:hypothetical protein